MFAVSVTDQDWFEFLRDREYSGQVNFWTPTPWSVKRLNAGDEWHFLLKSPVRKLSGYGVFQEYREFSIQEAWRLYGTGNGVSTESALVSLTRQYSEKNSLHPVTDVHSVIGGVILSNVEFYDDDEYLDPAQMGLDFKRQIVKFKYFDGSLVGSLGLEALPPTSEDEFRPIASEPTEYSKQRRKKRRGQQLFRSRLMEAYGGKCAVTGESHERVLEATHIEPYINISSNHIQNGMLLRVDIHRLMDEGLLALDNDLKLLVSSKLDSSSYVAYRGVQINLSSKTAERPSTHAVRMHREERFQE